MSRNKPITFATVCYLRRGNKVLLLKKAEGLFGGGKWNAPGGKVQPGESPESAAVREMREETGLTVRELHFHGMLNFYLGKDRRLDQTVFVFSSRKMKGTLRQGDEGELRWFDVRKLPYADMWEDDKDWLPNVIAGESFVGDFYFTDNYGRIFDFQMTPATNGHR